MRYPGGKGKCFHRLINLMPRHSTYIESHLGGGAVLRHKRPAEVNIGIDRDPNVIDRWRRHHPGMCTLIHADATAFLEDYPFLGDELIYADPPYMQETRRRARVYRYDYARRDHSDLLAVLMAAPCQVLISGYDNDLYQSVLRHWRRVSFTAKTHVGLREECVWMNFEPSTHLHDGSYLGETFRDRQTIRRRHARMLQRFDHMNASERQHLLGMLAARYPQEPATS